MFYKRDEMKYGNGAAVTVGDVYKPICHNLSIGGMLGVLAKVRTALRSKGIQFADPGDSHAYAVVTEEGVQVSILIITEMSPGETIIALDNAGFTAWVPGPSATSRTW